MQPLISPFSKIHCSQVKVYLIGLREKEDRLKISYKRLIEAGYNQEKIQISYGIYAKYNPEKIVIARNKWNFKNDEEITKPEEACAIAHLETYQKILESQDPFAIICEDDILFPNNWKEIYTQAYSLIPNDADIVYFGWGKNFFDPPYSTNKFPYLKYKPICCHCYLVTKKAASKIINEVNKNGIDDAIDTWLKDDKVNCLIYSINPRYDDFAKLMKGDKTREQSQSYALEGLVFQDKNLGSNLQEGRALRITKTIENKIIKAILKPFFS